MAKTDRLAVCLVLLAAMVLMVCAPGCTTPESGKVEKKELIVAMRSEPVSLNPFVGGDFASNDVMRQIFDTLLTRDKDGTIKPMLAEKFEMENPTTWVVKLRKGVKFHNGEPFDAEAVKFTYDTMLDPATKARGRMGVLGVTKVEVVDSYTVKIHTEKPMPILPERNVFGGTGSVIIVPPKYYKEVGPEKFAEHPIGTGPFRFVERVKGDFVKLEAYDEYWRGRPKVDVLTFKIIPEHSTRLAALLSGQVHIAVDLPFDLAEKVKASPNTKLLTGTFGQGNLYFQFNPIGPFADKRVRLAVSHAVDMDRIIQSLFGDYAVRVGVPLDPASFGFNPNVKPYPYDPEKARQLLAEAGYPQGFSTVLHTSTRYPYQKEITEAMAQELAKVGIKAEIVMSESNQYLELMANRKAGPLYMISWGTLEGDADLLVNEFHSSSAFATWNDPQVDKLLDEARVETNPEKRRELYYQVQQLLIDQVAYIPGFKAKWVIGVTKNVNWDPLLGRALYFWNASLE